MKLKEIMLPTLSHKDKLLACELIMQDKPVMVNIKIEVREDFNILALSEMNKGDGIISCNYFESKLKDKK
ncbi:MAG: hypothetical protein E3J43_09955 [Candidatus Heimdallarchaeota archaeon]|nr:MAG: hypothetical protein E3J43_09955 [Candidatus Heimdallarchaeota archaeon]